MMNQDMNRMQETERAGAVMPVDEGVFKLTIEVLAVI